VARRRGALRPYWPAANRGTASAPRRGPSGALFRSANETLRQCRRLAAISSTELNTTPPTCARFPSPNGKILRCLPELRRRVKVTKRGTGYLRPSAVSRNLGRNILPAMHSSIWELNSKLLADFWTRKIRVNETLRSKSIRRLRHNLCEQQMKEPSWRLAAV
jgi:hypothetical protein